MGTNLTKELGSDNRKNDDDMMGRKKPVNRGNEDCDKDDDNNRYMPDLSMFQGHDVLDNTFGNYPNTNAYDSFDNALEEESVEKILQFGPLSPGDSSQAGNLAGLSHNRSGATYIDLDMLTTLETRISSLRDRIGCPIYYLGWT